MIKIGIIGFGFVGRAIAFGFSPCKEVAISYFDPKEVTSTPVEQLIRQSNILFVCVPTPVATTGEADTSIVDKVMKQIVELQNSEDRPIVCIKSTLIPSALARYSALYPNIRLTMAPEFLTERTSLLDFINANRIILGGKPEDTAVLASLHRLRFVHTPIYECDLIAASLVKYACNSFFALKVSFMNELKSIVDKSGTTTDWTEIVKMFLADQRIGNSHYQVPGPDGKLGFGGKCLPKDLSAFASYAEDLGALSNTLKAAQETNLTVRPTRDWEAIEGVLGKTKKS